MQNNIIDSIRLSGTTYQIQGSGGGKAIEAGRGIAITTGETADTVSVSLPISAGTGTNSIAQGNSTTASGNYSHAEGANTRANGDYSHTEGKNTKANGLYSHAEGWATKANGDNSHAEGFSTNASGINSHAEGYYTITNNDSEHANGQYNVSNSASIYFGDSGNTLFSVGNGTDDDARHNAFEIRQNGDIYISSGNTDIKLQDHLGGSSITVDTALDSGSTNPVANSAITTALGDKVNVADNNASAYTFENKISGVEYGYSEHFAGPIYIRYTGSTSSSGGYFAGNILCYTSEWGWENISLSFDLSDGQITATTVSSAYFDVEIENGEATLTFKDGYYLRQCNSQNGFIALTKTTYESGQSADVIEDTVYDVFDKLNDKIDKTSDNAITGGSIYFSNGYLDLNLYNKNGNTDSSIKIDSSTIKSSNNGLSVQFETSEAADKILNVGSGSYGQLFSINSYDTSLNEFTITFNPNYTQSNVYHFQVRIKDASNVAYGVIFEYDSADMSAEYTDLSTYCTVTDTLSTDYKLKVTAKEGYKIARLYNSEYMVGGVDNTTPNNYISNLVTTPSYVHDGQDVIDDIYDKLDDKQDTLVSSQNIKTINNQSLLGSGNIDIQGGGSSYTAGDGIDITNDVISVTGKADTSAVTEVSDALTAHTDNTTVHTTAAEKSSWNGAATNASNALMALGGLSLIKLTQAEYDALGPNYDSNKLYVIVN